MTLERALVAPKFVCPSSSRSAIPVFFDIQLRCAHDKANNILAPIFFVLILHRTCEGLELNLKLPVYEDDYGSCWSIAPPTTPCPAPK